MTNAELIARLQELPPDHEAAVWLPKRGVVPVVEVLDSAALAAAEGREITMIDAAGVAVPCIGLRIEAR